MVKQDSPDSSERLQGASKDGGPTPGRFCWVDLGASNQSHATAFYVSVMGWNAKNVSLPQGGDYTLLKSEGKEAAGLYALSDDQKNHRVPAHWLPYVAV